MAKILKDYNAPAWKKFADRIGDEAVSQACLLDWESLPNRFIIESDDWALPCWIADRNSEPFLLVDDQIWKKYRNWQAIYTAYISDHGPIFICIQIVVSIRRSLAL